MSHHLALAGLLWALAVAVPWSLGDGAGTVLAQEVRNPQGVAVIIGNRDYQHRDVPDVTYAHRDADAFRRYVIDVHGYDPENIIDLRDAARRKLFDAFGTRTTPKGLLWSYLNPKGGSEILVFYSGHGVPGVHDGRGYLLPVDADPKAAEDDGYPIDLLYENLGGLAEADTVRVYLDACFSGGSNDGVLIKDASPVYVTPALPKGVGESVVSLTAASGEQIASWDARAKHGLFTHHLLDALYGGGDADGDGHVTAVEVKAYLDNHMTRAARRQHRRVQEANLLGSESVVLASAPADGVFPARSDPDATDWKSVRTPDEKGEAEDTASALDLVAVTGGHAILTAETTPPGAAVLVGGAKVGETPLERYDLRAGTYTMVLDHPTYETVVLEDHTLADNRVLSIERTLVPATGAVTVITEPSGAWVERGGERLAATTPVTLDGLPSGPLVLTLGAEGHRQVEVEVGVPKDGVARVERELEESRLGTLTLELEPADAQVTLVGNDTPYQPGMTLAEGEHEVRVTREGYRAAARVVVVSGETRLRIALEPEPQPFTVVTTPPNAEVRFLEGTEGYRPGMVLIPGTYRVRVSAEGWETQEVTVQHGAASTRHAVTLKRVHDPAADEAALGLDREDRRRIQRGLASLGFEPGPADGIFGGGTRGAIGRWQSSQGDEATGYLDGKAAEMLLAVAARIQANLRPKCSELTGGYLGDNHAACWEEMRNQPGCYAWTEHYHSDISTNWTGPCPGGVASGRGTLTLSSGSEHGSQTGSGSIKLGKRDGHWSISGSDGYRFAGEYRNGKRHGQGTYTFAVGDNYEGEFRNGKRHGQGTYTYADGRAKTCDWHEGAAFYGTCTWHGTGVRANSCRFARDGACDEPNLCKLGTDAADCAR